MADDYDTPWKNALSRYFPEFMAFYFPAIYADIDWQQPVEFLDQDMAQLTPDAVIGPRRVDKLARVSMLTGPAQPVLVHVEVQNWPGRTFAERIFVYNYRIYDRHRCPVTSLAVTADSGYRPPDAAAGRAGIEADASGKETSKGGNHGLSSAIRTRGAGAWRARRTQTGHQAGTGTGAGTLAGTPLRQ